MSNWFQWRHDRPARLTRSFRWNLNQWAGWNYDGDNLFSGGNFNAHAVFVNHWSAGFGVNVDALGFDDRATRGGPGAYRSASRSLWTYVNTDSRKRLSFYVNTFNSSLDEGGGFADVSPGFTFRPATFVSVSAGVGISRNKDPQQWIGDDEGHYVFGRIDQKTVGVRFRFNYTVTPGADHPDVRGTLRLGRQLFRLQGACRRPRETDQRSFRALCVRRQPRFQLSLFPHDQRAPLGIQARVDAVRRLAAGTRGHDRDRTLRFRS